MNKAITNKKRSRQDQRRRSSNVISSMLGRSMKTSTLGEIVSLNYIKSNKNFIGLIKSIRQTVDQLAGGKLRDQNAKESWALLEFLALYDNESWNEPRDFANPVKAITLPQDVPSTSDRCLSSSKINGPHDTQYCMEDLEQAFVEYASSRTDEAEGDLKDSRTKENEEEEKDKLENIHFNSFAPPGPSISFITEKVLKLNSIFESLRLVPSSSNTKLVCTKEEDGDVMFIEIVPKDDDSRKEEPKAEEQEVEHFDMFPTRSELAYHKYLMCGTIPSIFL
ncbi:hypothetical protein Tco_1356126 [Tanacetum coccineum]